MIKLTELLSEKYLYPKGTPLQKGFQQMTKDIDKMMKYSKTWDKFYGDFKRKYSEYPDDTESVGELEALYNDYHSPNEMKVMENENDWKQMGFRSEEEYNKFLNQKLKTFVDKIKNNKELLNVFKRLKDR